VDLDGFEPSTSSMPWKRAPNCATGPLMWRTSNSLPRGQRTSCRKPAIFEAMRGWSFGIAVAVCLCSARSVLAAKKPPLPDPEIAAIQEQLASLDAPGGYYATTYRPTETGYWASLPEWMRMDARSHRAARVLDIGCGYGTLLALAADIYMAEPHCMDLKRYLPEFGKARGFYFTAGNIQLDPIPAPGRFDVIVMTEVLEHFNFDPLPTLRKIHNALAPNGVFFLTTPDAAAWGRQTKYYKRFRDLPPADVSKPFIDDHIWIYNKTELLDLLQKAGFRVTRFAYSGVGHRHFNLALSRL
jgi:SAM-dependent methyltransferase